MLVPNLAVGSLAEKQLHALGMGLGGALSSPVEGRVEEILHGDPYFIFQPGGAKQRATRSCREAALASRRCALPNLYQEAFLQGGLRLLRTLSVVSSAAPASSKSSTVRTWPLADAHSSGVNPFCARNPGFRY